MDIVSADGAMVVSLSRRNLEHLLAGLDLAEQEGSGDPVLHRACAKGVLVVVAQENDRHYDGRVAGPGLEPYLPKSPPATDPE
jgi:hypothetical protein